MTAAARTEAGKAQNRTAHLFEAFFDDELVRTTDAPRSIVWNGNTYQAVGHFLGFSGVQESADLRIEQCTVRLTHCDQAKTWVALVLNEEIIDRRLVIYKTFLNDANAAVIDPIPIFDGRMDAYRIVEDLNEGTVLVVARSHWADFERRPGRRTNDVVQQLHFSGDKFFEFCSGIAAQRLVGVWGRPPPPPPATPPPPPAEPDLGVGGDSGDSGFGGEGGYQPDGYPAEGEFGGGDAFGGDQMGGFGDYGGDDGWGGFGDGWGGDDGFGGDDGGGDSGADGSAGP